MTRMFVVLMLSTLLVGCAFSVSTTRSKDAPDLAPSAFAEVVHVPPTGSTEIARFDALGNNWQSASDCEAKLVLEARKVGADVVFVQPEESGLGQGPRCSGIAYRK